MHALPRGHRLDMRKRQIDMLLDVSHQVEAHTICGLGDAAA
jgi:NADH:ubiquinone oxidoreductase subunit F (NADH-binding)